MFDLKRFGVRARLMASGGLLLVVAGVTVWLWWPSQPEPRARQFLDVTACLLTGEGGLDEPGASLLWAGMGEASKATRVQTEYMAVVGEQTMENARAYVKGLAVGHCDVLFAVGAAQVAAVQDVAPSFPKVLFYTVRDGRSQGNVTRVDGDLVKAANEIVTNAVAGTSG